MQSIGIKYAYKNEVSRHLEKCRKTELCLRRKTFILVGRVSFNDKTVLVSTALK